MTDKRENHIGSSFGDFLDEEGIKADVETVARKRVADLAAMLFGDQGVDLSPHPPVSVRNAPDFGEGRTG